MLIRIGSEVQINLDPNVDHDQLHPDVALMTDGRFFVAYEDQNSPDFPRTSRLSASSSMPPGPCRRTRLMSTGPEFDGGIQINPAVAPRANGAAIVVWQDRRRLRRRTQHPACDHQFGGQKRDARAARNKRARCRRRDKRRCDCQQQPRRSHLRERPAHHVWERHVTDTTSMRECSRRTGPVSLDPRIRST